MYSDQDLDEAVKKGILSKTSVDNFRVFIHKNKQTAFIDEENFRLVNSFNDIFVLIACLLLLLCSYFFIHSITKSLFLTGLVIMMLSWLLAEFFVIKRQMALPSVALLISFLSGLILICLPSDINQLFNTNFALIGVVILIGAIIHWLRFKVPITIASTTGSIIILILLTIKNNLPDNAQYQHAVLTTFILLSGIFTFLFAMYWDKSDIKRITYRSDVAFWLHLIAAPMIVHSFLTILLGLFNDNSLLIMLIILMLYVLIVCLSIVIERRALMISALGYVIYALTKVLNTLDSFLIDYHFAITGIIIGSSLLLLAIYWHKARYYLLKIMPDWIIKNVPLSH